ncbi:MAG TPA: PQQ-binding-like beta-propeller repeat protein [Fimbriimonadaceae bacterium]|nr:PQQ-binding-like beta-propeller repeat protein [Fimbriimonadaceae bacterium]
MDKRILIGTLSLLAASVTAQPIAVGPPVPRNSQPWQMDHANPARTGQSYYPGPASGQIAWTRRLAGGVYAIACNRQGQAILGVSFHNQWWSNEMFAQAYNGDGTIAWRIKVQPYQWGASQGVRSGPALDAGGNAWMNSSNGQLIKVSPQGDLLATVQRTSSFTNDSTPALLGNGDIVQLQALTLAKYDALGIQIWSNSASSQTDVAVSPNGDCALGGVRTNEPHGSIDLTYFGADGTRRWGLSSSRGVRTQVCFGSDGTLFANRGGTVAYRPDGSVVWAAGPGGWGCALDGLGHVLVPQSNQLNAFNRSNGTLAWNRTLPAFSSIVEGPSIDGLNNIYLATTDGWLYGLRGSSGTVFISVKVGATCTTQPAIGAGNCLFVGVTKEVSPNWYENYLVKVN